MRPGQSSIVKLVMAKDLERYIDKVAEGIVLPTIKDVGLGALKQQAAVSMALPAMSGVSSDAMYGNNPKAEEAALRNYQLGVAHGITKNQLKRNALVSKAEEQSIEKNYRRDSRLSKKRLGIISRNNVKGKNRYANRFAGEVLGIDRDLHRILG